MKTLWRTVLQAHNVFRLELHAIHDDHESRVVYDKDGPLAVLLPCLEDGTVDHSAVDEHNRGTAVQTKERAGIRQNAGEIRPDSSAYL